MATVSDILSRKGRGVVSMVADESVLNAARLMNERGIGAIIVTDRDKMVGIFTERDVLRRVVAEQRDPARARLGEVMTSPVVTGRPPATVEDVAALCTNRRIRHLPVMQDDELIGIITSGDVLAYQVDEQKDMIQFLNSYVFDLR
jgi:CBS domain-containing protein